LIVFNNFDINYVTIITIVTKNDIVMAKAKQAIK